MSTIKKRKYKDSIYIVYTHKSRIFKIYTGVRIEQQYWISNCLVKSCPEYKNKHSNIAFAENKVLAAITAVQSKGFEPTADMVRMEYYSQIKPFKKEVPFWESYRTFLNLLTCRESTKRKVTITYNVLEYFCKYAGYKPSADSFDKVIFGRFIMYLMENQKMADSTIHRHVKALKAFFRFAYPEKNISFMKYSILHTPN
ncbi:MAG TPA: phage integrase SAM-like domain-containing protein [Bacteroidales bacterium]|nr:phage integrase SAM-like domain-containing protein [Bacteroidales bacterium]